MLKKSGGRAPPRPRPGKALWAPPAAANRMSWFGARLRMASAHCRLADLLFRLLGRKHLPIGAGSKRGGMRIKNA